MDANEHERLSNITLMTQVKVKEQCFYCCSTLQSHSIRVFNDDHNSYLKMSVTPFPPQKKTKQTNKQNRKNKKQKNQKKIKTFLHKNIWFIKVCWPVSQTWIYFYLHVSTFMFLMFFINGHSTNLHTNDFNIKMEFPQTKITITFKLYIHRLELRYIFSCF